MKLTMFNTSANELKVVIYVALLVLVFFLCKEVIDVVLHWISGSFQSFTPPSTGG